MHGNKRGLFKIADVSILETYGLECTKWVTKFAKVNKPNDQVHNTRTRKLTVPWVKLSSCGRGPETNGPIKKVSKAKAKKLTVP